MIIVTIVIHQAGPRVEANFKANARNASADELEVLDKIAERFKNTQGAHVESETRIEYDEPPTDP